MQILSLYPRLDRLKITLLAFFVTIVASTNSASAQETQPSEIRILQESFNLAVPHEYVSDFLTAFQVNSRILVLKKTIPGWDKCKVLKNYVNNEYGYDVGALSCEILRSFVVALSFYPPRTFPLKLKNEWRKPAKGKVIMADNLLFDALATANDEKIEISVNAATGSQARLIGTLIHELAHQVDADRGRISYSDGWKKISGWSEIEAFESQGYDDTTRLARAQFVVNVKLPILLKHGVISRYCVSEFNEEFAEAVSAYVQDIGEFAAASPGIYNFIKTQVFGKNQL